MLKLSLGLLSLPIRKPCFQRPVDIFVGCQCAFCSGKLTGCIGMDLHLPEG